MALEVKIQWYRGNLETSFEGKFLIRAGLRVKAYSDDIDNQKKKRKNQTRSQEIEINVQQY